ncbi:glycerophosphodiester phosphodiesterase [Rhizobium sp. YTU87027]|uniref:glycerophosphodiester phosphodiesterase n=1 Tax=Rhizobium sp. YTU87027 TaxID=3417741 RepID=UPI003D691F6A
MMRDFSSFFDRYRWPAGKGQLPFCIGHRGASGHARENTLAAFRLAAELGAEMWELDTQLTKDGVVVVSHDDHLGRVFGVDRHISGMTAAELAALEGVEVPTFEAVAALGRETGTGLYVELKAPGSGLRCWHHLREQDQRFACLGSFDTAQVRELREAGCDYPLSVLIRVGNDAHAMGDEARADILHLCWERAGERPQDLVTPALTDRAFAEGREIVLWHEERRPILNDIMKLPVLGICTDLPEMMRTAWGGDENRGRQG